MPNLKTPAQNIGILNILLLGIWDFSQAFHNFLINLRIASFVGS